MTFWHFTYPQEPLSKQLIHTLLGFFSGLTTLANYAIHLSSTSVIIASFLRVVYLLRNPSTTCLTNYILKNGMVVILWSTRCLFVKMKNLMIALCLENNPQNPADELVSEQSEILRVVHFSIQDYLNILMISLCFVTLFWLLKLCRVTLLLLFIYLLAKHTRCQHNYYHPVQVLINGKAFKHKHCMDQQVMWLELHKKLL